MSARPKTRRTSPRRRPSRKPSLAAAANGPVADCDRWATPSTLPWQERMLDVYRNDYSVSAADVEVNGVALGSFYGPKGMFAGSRARVAANYGAEAAHFLTGGSSIGNQMIARYLNKKRLATVLVGRNAHHSGIDAFDHEGLTFYFLPPGGYDPEFEAFRQPTPADVAAALARHRDVNAVVVSSPTYEGRECDIAGIAEVVHGFTPSLPLIVDAAWGAHFPFHNELPESALVRGADLMVTSAHKCGGALQSAALLLARSERVDLDLLAAAHDELATTSPSAAVLTSIDSSQTELSARGHEHVGALLELVADVRARLARDLPELAVLEVDDETKLTIGLGAHDIGGYAVAAALRERRIVAEKAGAHAVTFVATFQLRPHADARLVEALKAILAGVGSRRSGPEPRDPFASLEDVPVIPPRMARVLSHGYSVPIAESAGFVAAQRLELYPPGIPMLVPGFRITTDAVDLLLAARESGGALTTAGPFRGRVAVVPRQALNEYLTLKGSAE